MLNKNISLKIVGYKDWTEMSKKKNVFSAQRKPLKDL